MSDEQKPKDGVQQAAVPQDLLKNMKTEFERKLSNIESNNKKLMDQMTALLQPKAAPQQQQAKFEDVWYEDPRKAAEIIKQELRQESQAAARTNTTLAKLVQEFPELNDEGSDLTKRAVEIFDGFSADEKASPVAYRAAVREAAQELGMAPASKRKRSEEDDFSLSGSGAGRSRSERKASRDTLDPNTIEFAQFMGLDTEDPKLRERLKGHQKRIWTRYGK